MEVVGKYSDFMKYTGEIVLASTKILVLVGLSLVSLTIKIKVKLENSYMMIIAKQIGP